VAFLALFFLLVAALGVASMTFLSIVSEHWVSSSWELDSRIASRGLDRSRVLLEMGSLDVIAAK